jgi:repressor LexA
MMIVFADAENQTINGLTKPAKEYICSVSPVDPTSRPLSAVTRTGDLTDYLRTRMKLTRRQQDILDFIRQFIHEHHFPPSIRDIAAHFSLASAGGVHKHLNNLKAKGVITFENNISRSIHILNAPSENTLPPPTEPPVPSALELPLMGKVAAGQPIQHFLENETITVPISMVRHPDRSYALQVQGDSMIEDGIFDGDYVIVEHRDYADNGDTVIAMIDHETATVKKFYREGNRVRLQPANHSLAPILVHPTAITIHGRVVGVLRRY